MPEYAVRLLAVWVQDKRSKLSANKSAEDISRLLPKNGVGNWPAHTTKVRMSSREKADEELIRIWIKPEFLRRRQILTSSPIKFE